MTATILESPSSTGRLEDLVDRLLAALFPPEPAPNLVRTVHEARRLRQSRDLDGALEVFNGVDAADASDTQLRWLYAEWLDITRRRFSDGNAMLYSPAIGKAAVLVEREDGILEAAAVLGMRWPVGKLVSRRSLRRLKPLHNKETGGSAW